MSAKRTKKVKEEELFDPVMAQQAEIDRQEGTREAPAAPQTSQDEINAKLSQVLEKLADNVDRGPVKQVPLAKAIVRTPWNPTGSRLRPRLQRVTRMNGYRLTETKLTNNAIRMFNQLKGGKYNGGRWVVIDSTDPSGVGGAIDLYVQNKSFADRIQLKADARNIDELLWKIIKEQGDEPNLEGELTTQVKTVAQLRAEGKTGE